MWCKVISNHLVCTWKFLVSSNRWHELYIFNRHISYTEIYRCATTKSIWAIFKNLSIVVTYALVSLNNLWNKTKFLEPSYIFCLMVRTWISWNTHKSWAWSNISDQILPNLESSTSTIRKYTFVTFQVFFKIRFFIWTLWYLLAF